MPVQADAAWSAASPPAPRDLLSAVGVWEVGWSVEPEAEGPVGSGVVASELTAWVLMVWVLTVWVLTAAWALTAA